MIKRPENLKVILLMCLFSLWFCSADAAPYFIGTPVKLESLLVSPEKQKKAQTRQWLVVPKTLEHEIRLEFLPGFKKGIAPICCVAIRNTPQGNLVEWSGKGSQTHLVGERGFLIHQGYPAPGDVFPILKEGESSRFKMERQAGGRMFTEFYTVSASNVECEQAMENGWIKIELPKDVKELLKISVKNSDGRVVGMQIWGGCMDWWLFEETAYRKSWRVE